MESKTQNGLRGALLLIAVGLIANAVVMALKPTADPTPIFVGTAQAQGSGTGPIYPNLGNNYFYTVDNTGQSVFLWRYRPSGIENQNSIAFIMKASSPR